MPRAMPRLTPKLLAASSSMLVLAAIATGAYAADPAPAKPAATDTPEVVVTGSRIMSRGFTQPTPTTTLSSMEIAKTAEPNIFNTIAELPSLQGSTGRATSVGSTSSGIQGLSSFSLRGLQPIRTLTLLDGQRVVPANVTGVPDISQFPQLLVKRVDVVTGGASASYGSDAIGGVVNFITDKKFEGVKANLEAGQTTYGDDQNITAQLAWGHGFLNDRLHVEASGEFSKEGGVPSPGFGEVGANGRDWYNSPAFQVRPIGQTNDGKPQYTYVEHAQQYQYAKYGLITSGPLQGTAFGANGTPYQFQYGSNGVPTGTGAVTNCVNPFCVGGDLNGLVGAGTNLAMNLKRTVAYTRVGYDLNDDNEIYMTANLAEVKAQFSPNPGAAKNANLTIQCSNPFVPASIQAACVTNNITSFQFGTSNAEFPNNIDVHPTRRQERFVVGADGKFNAFGTNWSYDAYAEHGTNHTDILVYNMSLNSRYVAAIDAIAGPNGTVICRDPVARAAGCKPLNVIGNVPASAEAMAYIEPAKGPQQHTIQTQDVASLNVTGEPFALWAGPVAVAAGVEWRKEHYKVRADPYGTGVSADSPNSADYPADPLLNTSIGNNWYAGNYHNAQGTYTVGEGYLELNVPVLSSATWGDANINLADRRTHYSTSGDVESWKVGANWKTGISGLRLRAVTSQDVRAPNLSELYAAALVTNNVVSYQGNTITVQQRTIGNVNLRPELARNTEIGIVLTQPDWLPGFSASVDFFDIKVNDVISSLSAQQEVDLCVAGNQEICSAMVLNSTAVNGNYVTVQAFNLASLSTKGYDIEAQYRFKLASLGLPGTFTVRALGTHTDSFLTNPGVIGTIPSESAGVNQGATPTWKVLGVQSWENDKITVNLTERWISDGVYNNEWIECQTNCPVATITHPTIYDNKMKGATYIDIGATYAVSKKITAYAKVDNLLNVDPVPSPQTNVTYGVNPLLYDVLGRMYRVGVRYNF